MFRTITFEQARDNSQYEYVWRARLRSGDVIWEQPGVSSDHLPADRVVSIGYVPCRRPDLPTIDVTVDVDRGERFVRYWTTIWKPTGRGTQLLYCIGIEHRGRHALLCYYTRYNKIVLASSRPFQPTWLPDPFGLLPRDATMLGGPGTARFGWLHDGFGGLVEIQPGNRLLFRSNR
jgi:hypothetical protein